METLIAAGVLAMSALFFALAGSFPELVADPGGLALFPRTVAVFAGAASAAFLIQVFLRRAPTGYRWGATSGSASAWLRAHRVEVLSFALVGLLPFLIEWFGFVAAVGIFSVLILAVSGIRFLPLALTASLTTAGVYVGYAVVLGATLPRGSLWD